MTDKTRQLQNLPVFLLPGEAAPHGPEAIRIGGLVERPSSITLVTIRALPAHALSADFACEEGWSVPGLRWRGARLADVTASARPLPAAHYVLVCSGRFCAAIPREQVESPAGPLLAYELDGQPLPAEHGGPLRLIAPDLACYQTVKWVDRITLAESATEDTATEIATARLRALGGQQ